MESPEAVIATIEQIKHEFITAMFLLGCGQLADLHLNDSLLLNEY
jgi:isopentenyl diphosphate isomerase/L-lactate dehydrogenase-like FMN-dependent dehydrogenase